MQKLPTLKLGKDQERRLLAGHAWVYSNEVDTKETPLKAFSAGEQVAVVSQRGKWIGNAYVNPHALICARIVSTDISKMLDETLLTERINQALQLRQRLYENNFYRLVYGESDFLPGLVIDRYGDYLVVQITTAGMEAVRSQIVSILEKLLSPRGILLRNDTPMRAMEGLDSSVTVVSGDIPPLVQLSEGESSFEVSLLEGQKTGWFFDQAANRNDMRRYIREGDSVLDICSYVGAWGIRAARAGATEVICVDSSNAALEQVKRNAEMNGVQEQVRTMKNDAFERLKKFAKRKRQFDMVILDPPAFIKRKKDLKEGMQAYRRLNALGLEVLKPGGILVTSSCSFHMAQSQLLNVVRQGSVRERSSLQLLQYGQQGADHPVHPAIPETSYLKTLFLHKV
ncbi:MAG: class I SAM-dependent rRNA methyltransferase [Gammaproteobacteria bacterium]|nr:class I SAM-dependent rRNA methyltransferase [Gammaproteobacteria bacterium]